MAHQPPPPKQSKYAQLVDEAQSPEPPLEAEDQEVPAAAAAAATGPGLPSPAPAPANHAHGQQSRCSSTDQLSSSFVSTLEESSSRPDGLDDQPASSSDQDQRRPRHNNHDQSRLERSVSRSMLALDEAAHKLQDFSIQWQDLSFTYQQGWLAKLRSRPQRVLQQISGSLRSNELAAVIGPSGCGKTTLLQFLAGRDPGPRQRHRLRILGLEEPKVAFIGQDDCLLPGLTARETLLYASRLQNRRRNFDHHAHVEPILGALGLRECADRSVTKLSGGQAKRVTIGQELLYPTNLLVLDELTSGLDASTSYSIVRLLKRLVGDRQYPMSIVMSIHQPSAKLFAVFDRCYLMSEGHCLYEGSTRIDLVNAHLGRFGLECPKFHNIADYLIEIASEDLSPGDQLIKEHMVQFQRKQRQLALGGAGPEGGDQQVSPAEEKQQVATADSPLEAAELVELGALLQPNSQNSTTEQSQSLFGAVERARARRERPILHQLVVHFQRSLLRIRRSNILTYLQLLTYILLGLQLATFYGPEIGQLSGCPSSPASFVAFVFSQQDGEEPLSGQSLEMRRIQENMNFLLVAIMTATFAALEITVITFPMEAKTVKREWRNGWYRCTSYFLGRTLADLPFQLAFVCVFSALVYTLTGQAGLFTWRFGSFVAIMALVALVAQTVGFIFGALFMDNLPAAVFTAPLCIFPALLFSGFFSRVSQVPAFYKPLTYLSHFRYAFDALLVTLYGFDRCPCDQELLDAYHSSVSNQTGKIKDMFRSLFGVIECESSAGGNAAENSIEDTAVAETLETLLKKSTQAPLAAASTALEDALVNTMFEHMASNPNTSTSSPAGELKGDAMDRLVDKFSARVTTMLNSQSNFGHPTPSNCSEFNSYLMTEFELRNNDLMFGLAMLLLFVLVTRFLCNIILSFAMASRK